MTSTGRLRAIAPASAMDRSPDPGSSLRLRAEAAFRDRVGPSPDQFAIMSPEATRRLFHDLGVHQIELEMQNEELRRAQAELDRVRARYFDLFDLAPVGYCTITMDGLIIEANLTTATLLGVERVTLARQRFSRFIHPDDQDHFYRMGRVLARTGMPQTVELRMTRDGGVGFWARIDAAIAQDGDGTAICRVVVSDVSRQKQAEETRSLLETRLAQTQKMESIGLLAGGVAHDFNNMLQVITGNVFLIERQIAPGTKAHEHLISIQKAAQHSIDLTSQLLAFARKQIRSPRVLDLNGAIATILTMIQRLIGENIRFIWSPCPQLWPVHMDPAQFSQILVNLAVNARDAIHGTGSITIAAANENCDSLPDHPGFVPGSYVVLTVSDDGCGMDRQTLDHLFEPFFTTKDQGQGTGMGLATVFGIIRQNHGFITVRSEPGRGTSFRILLPRCDTAVATGTRRPQAEAVPLGHETVLLVEDKLELLDMGDAFLTGQGYTVLAAPTASAALLMAQDRTDPIDLLITDVVMPGMSGTDLYRHLIRLNPAMRCLFISGSSSDVIARHGILSDDVEFLQKPFQLDQLASVMRTILDGGGADPASAPWPASPPRS